MSEISTLSPTLLWQWFDKICAVPHPSYHEDLLANTLLDWAKSQNLAAERDEAGNLLIRKPASAGMENRPTVALQAHLDMVPQANEGTTHDFTRDPIQPYIDGEWVTAKGTTLGADNGIGLASCLAVLSADNVAHPPLEVLLTMTEEAGMEGASGLRPNWLTAKTMINTDTEEIGEIYIGCAGGENADLTIPTARVNNTYRHSARLVLKGLRGGHSGCDIHTNRVNAIKLLARILQTLQTQHSFVLADIQGGSVRNAIPREATATLCFDGDENALAQALSTIKATLEHELALCEKDLLINLEPLAKPTDVFDRPSSEKVIHLLNLLPNGVIRNSDAVAGVVESSLSIGILQTDENGVKGVILLRSLIESGKAQVRSQLDSLAALGGAQIRYSGNYPGWEPDLNSQITPLLKAAYADVLGEDPQIKVIHAGLECGLIKKVYPEMDLVSLGPTIRNAHSPDEKVHIKSVETYWNVLVKTLAQM